MRTCSSENLKVSETQYRVSLTATTYVVLLGITIGAYVRRRYQSQVASRFWPLFVMAIVACIDGVIGWVTRKPKGKEIPTVNREGLCISPMAITVTFKPPEMPRKVLVELLLAREK